MSLEKIETVENPLLERTEISALFDSKSGSLTRKEAIDLISKKARIDSSTVYAIKLSNSSGSTRIIGLFYIYNEEFLAKKYLPTYIIKRNKIESDKDVKTESKPKEKATESKPKEKATESKPKEKATESKPKEKATESKPEEKIPPKE